MVDTICASCKNPVQFDPMYDFKKLVINNETNLKKYNIDKNYISNITDKLIICKNCLK